MFVSVLTCVHLISPMTDYPVCEWCAHTKAEYHGNWRCQRLVLIIYLFTSITFTCSNLICTLPSAQYDKKNRPLKLGIYTGIIWPHTCAHSHMIASDWPWSNMARIAGYPPRGFCSTPPPAGVIYRGQLSPKCPTPVPLSPPLAEAPRFRLTAADAGVCSTRMTAAHGCDREHTSFFQLSSLSSALRSNGHKLIRVKFRRVSDKHHKWDIFNIPVASIRSSVEVDSEVFCF